MTITLTHDCPWHCRYCGFRSDGRGLVSEEEIKERLDRAERAGAMEILLISGERPDSLPHIRAALQARGYASFVEFACAVAKRILQRGLLPHGNYGALTKNELASCRQVHASMGVMLENVDDDPEIAPEKRAAGRLATIRRAGEQRIPFTSGILVGLGEAPESRMRSLDALARLHDEYGHLQEIIIQNFVPNAGSQLTPTPAALGLEEYRALIRHWRLVCPDVPVQIPPNLNPYWQELLPEINDLGGISPEDDVVNPGSPWQGLQVYQSAVRGAGVRLRERLAVYPRFIHRGGQEGSAYAGHDWLSSTVRRAVEDLHSALAGPLSASGSDSKAVDSVSSGSTHPRRHAAAPRLRPTRLWRDALWSLSTEELSEGARELRLRRFGRVTTYVVNRNANFTNICNVGCGFCGFARRRQDADAYVYDPAEVAERLAATPGITEACLQGGIHPDLGFEVYVELLRAIKRVLPRIHIHAFSPMEIHSLHLKSGRSYRDLLLELKDNGLGSIPGTAAEILVDSVRRRISGNKLSSDQWEAVIRTAHGVGLPSSATIMYGHVETWQDIRAHFERLIRIQEDTGGFTELVPLAFVPYRNRLGVRLAASTPGGLEAMESATTDRARRLYPLARLFFSDHIDHLQTSWVKLGVAGAVESLAWGCDDFGGTLFEESITRASGGQHGESMAPEALCRVLTEAGYIPQQRSTLYGPAESSHVLARQNAEV